MASAAEALSCHGHRQAEFLARLIGSVGVLGCLWTLNGFTLLEITFVPLLTNLNPQSHVSIVIFSGCVGKGIDKNVLPGKPPLKSGFRPLLHAHFSFISCFFC